jgi:hypothetical protein
VPDSVKFELSPMRDPDGSRLRDALDAHFRYERCSAIRVVLVHLVALGGVFPFVAAGWPTVLRRPVVACGLALWAVALVGGVIAGALEYRWYRKMSASMSDGGGGGPPA